MKNYRDDAREDKDSLRDSKKTSGKEDVKSTERGQSGKGDKKSTGREQDQDQEKRK
jgi:hypothetical protein